MRPQGYRKSFFTAADLGSLLPNVWDQILKGRDLWEQGQLHPADWVTEVLNSVWRVARPFSWRNGRLTNTQFRLRGIPEGAQALLLNWSQDLVPLTLRIDIPSPIEILELQTRGGRCVSCLVTSPEMFAAGHEGRDGFSFLLHDLIHAHHFYKDQNHFLAQVFFSRWMYQMVVELRVQEHLESDLSFRDGFEYLISDMNTHIVHSIKCLKSVLPIQLHGLVLDSFFSVTGSVEKSERLSNIWTRLNTPMETGLLLVELDQIVGTCVPSLTSEVPRPRFPISRQV